MEIRNNQKSNKHFNYSALGYWRLTILIIVIILQFHAYHIAMIPTIKKN